MQESVPKAKMVNVKSWSYNQI